MVLLHASLQPASSPLAAIAFGSGQVVFKFLDPWALATTWLVRQPRTVSPGTIWIRHLTGATVADTSTTG